VAAEGDAEALRAGGEPRLALDEVVRQLGDLRRDAFRVARPDRSPRRHEHVGLRVDQHSRQLMECDLDPDHVMALRVHAEGDHRPAGALGLLLLLDDEAGREQRLDRLRDRGLREAGEGRNVLSGQRPLRDDRREDRRVGVISGVPAARLL
jgi:hypothetical protein